MEDGFSQARGLLGELPEDIESGISKTFDLIMEGLDKFFGGTEELLKSLVNLLTQLTVIIIPHKAFH